MPSRFGSPAIAGGGLLFDAQDATVNAGLMFDTQSHPSGGLRFVEQSNPYPGEPGFDITPNFEIVITDNSTFEFEGVTPLTFDAQMTLSLLDNSTFFLVNGQPITFDASFGLAFSFGSTFVLDPPGGGTPPPTGGTGQIRPTTKRTVGRISPTT